MFNFFKKQLNMETSGSSSIKEQMAQDTNPAIVSSENPNQDKE